MDEDQRDHDGSARAPDAGRLALPQELGHVPDRDPARLGLARQHEGAERARRGHDLRAGLPRLGHPQRGDPGALPHLDPRAAAARPAAERALAAPRHLDRSAVRGPEGGARRRGLPVVASEVARVVKGHRLGRGRARREAARLHQLREELGVMERRDRRRAPVAGPSSLRKTLKQWAQWVRRRWNRTPPSVPATRPAASRNAVSSPMRRAGSPVQLSADPEDGELDAGRLEEPRGGPRDLPAVGVEGAGAADPVEDVRRLAGPELAHAEVGRPRAAIGGHATERIAALRRRLERAGRGGVDGARLHERAPEVDELVQHLDLEGAGADARRARRAGPGFLGADQALERPALAHRLERRLDHAPRVERLAGRRRRAHRRASAAADARRGVEQLGPGEPLRLERGGLGEGGREPPRRSELAESELHRRRDHVPEHRRADQAEEDPAERRVRGPRARGEAGRPGRPPP